MRLGKYERRLPTQDEVEEAEKQGMLIDQDDYNYTPFKSFNRRRNYLIYTLSHKFDYLWSPEEKETLKRIESK